MKTEFLLLILIVIAITMEPVCLAGRRRKKGCKNSQKTSSNKANGYLKDKKPHSLTEPLPAFGVKVNFSEEGHEESNR